MHTKYSVAAVLLTSLFMTACASSAAPGAPRATAPSSASPAPVIASSPLEAGPAEPQPGTNPEWGDADQATALDAANAVIAVYAQPALGQAEWFAQLEPHLTPSARYAYQTVPNDQIRATTRQSGCELAPSDTAFLAIASCPTDAGTYTVLLQRDDGDTPWSTARITPPGVDQ